MKLPSLLTRATAAIAALGLCSCAAQAPAPAAAADSATGTDDTAAAADGAAVDGAGAADAAVDAVAAVDGAGAGVAAVSLSLAPTELLAALPDRDFLLINLVVPTKVIIEGTDLSVAATDTHGLEKALKYDKAAKVVFYCMSGKTSKMVMAKLNALGYLGLRDLAGGILAWQAAGLPTKKP